MNDTITITVKRYVQLLAAEEHLDALECAGVDNWEGYIGGPAGDEDDVARMLAANARDRVEPERG